MKSALAKDTVREIKKSFGRFLSIFAIVGIGVSFFSGVKASAPDMKFTADKYYDDYNLMDIRVLSTMGLTQDDVNKIKELQGVKGIFPTHSIDVISKIDSSERVFKLHGIPIDNLSDDNEDYINRVKIVEGRYPEKSGECIIENTKIHSNGLSIGDTIILESGTDDDILNFLKTKEFKVVGIAETPYYLSYEKGTSNIGNGRVDSFVIIPEEDFNIDLYTETYITVDGAKEFNSYKDEYFKVTDTVKDTLISLGKDQAPLRLDDIKKQAYEKLDSGKEEYRVNKENFDSEIKSASEKIESGKKELDSKEIELNIRESEFPQKIQENKDKIKEAENKLATGEEEYNNNLNIFNTEKKKAEEKIASYEKVINEVKGNIPKVEEKINDIKIKLENPNLSDIEKEVLNAELNICNGIVIGYNDAVSKIEDARTELANLEKRLQDARSSLDKGKREIEIQKAALSKAETEGKKGFIEARKQIALGKEKIKDSESEFERSKSLGEEELKLAEEKILNSEKKIEELKEPEWYVLDRNSHYSYRDYGSAADRINAISKVFPVFFFLVAALVCLTTMTRMVDEQRSTIGTLKALGYSKGKIASKYISYAATASIGGSVVGLAIGMVLFPTVIFNAWGIMYSLPPVVLKFDIKLALCTTLVAVSITTLAALFACYKELVETPSLLMRPRAPKEGKRILLERINFIWSRLSFIEKVTARNIFRYKKRFFMTVIGISGCTALLIAGFGIKDSLKTIINKQFGEILKYDSTIRLDENAELKIRDDLFIKYSNDSRVEEMMKISGSIIKVKTDNSDEKQVNLMIPSDIKEFKNFTSFRERRSQDEIELTGNGVLISEKLAKDLKVKKGDKINIENIDGYIEEVNIDGVIELYVDHYIFMTKDYYKNIFGVTPDFNLIITKLVDSTKEIEDSFSSEVMNEEGVKSVSFFTGITENFDNTISSLNYVVIVLIISAGALAFVVLYNLTNVNISERLREIATIKVLGFYDKEVSAYVYRENIILTIIGSLVGLGLGTVLHRFIMVTVELESVMFGRNINLISYLYGIVITLVFAVFVNLIMFYKLKNIAMVESLKSVE